MNKQFDFNTYWQSNVDFQAMGEKLVAGLILLGYPEDTAIYMVEQFQQSAFDDGYADAVFDSCGEDT